MDDPSKTTNTIVGANVKVSLQIEAPAKHEFYSNQTVLMVTCISFFLFVVAEIIGALAGHSLSLLGDAAAMSVDVFSYFSNMYAERIRNRGGDLNRGTKMMLEVYIPSFSICLLLGVTGHIMNESVKVLKGEGGKDDVNVYFMWGFSSCNALVDLLSTYFFIRGGRSVFFYTTVEKAQKSSSYREIIVADDEEDPAQTQISNDRISSEIIVSSKFNLNMASAFTHLGGDSLRTISVFIAAAVATATNIDGNMCDAWAAIIAATTIICIVIPLIREIYKTAMSIDEEAVLL
jgi:Co/Zn/Cd efflux system component